MLRKRLVILLLLSGISLGQSVPAAQDIPSLSQQQIQELIRKTADNDLQNNKMQRDYTYTQRQVERKLDGHGAVKSTEIKTSEIMELYGEPVERLVSKDDKPLSAKDADEEEKKIQKLIDERKNESSEQ